MEKILFTKEMKDEYKILIPTMLPTHFHFISDILNQYGYNTELLENSGRQVVETGLKYVHNDTCYPAILVIGQFINALQSGKYDVNKTALILMQTGGGCRASNYIPLLRKALVKAGYGQVPVISFTFAGVEKHPGFKLTLPIIYRMMYGVLYGDLVMNLKNQCKPYEIVDGDTMRIAQKWEDTIRNQFAQGNKINYKMIKQNYRDIVKDFAGIPRNKQKKTRVGIVGEIFVKYSPLGNNNLESFLESENAEVVVPGLLDFCLYSLYNGIVDTQLYGINKLKNLGTRVLYKYLIKKQQDIIDIINEESSFNAPTSFDHTRTLVKGYIGLGTKMGEGWLLSAEMLELVEMGVKNIVCTQPFGCLPNHISGKGMMKPIKERHKDVNIVAIDYDAGATAINQENRIKLMLANSKNELSKEDNFVNV